MSGFTPAERLLEQRQARQAGVSALHAPVQNFSYQATRYVQPASPQYSMHARSTFLSAPVLNITRYASRAAPPPPRPGFERINLNAAAPAVLTDEQSALLNARLELVGSAEAAGGLQASQGRIRQNAVAAFAEVLGIPENRVDRHVRGTSVVIRDVISTILIAERCPLPRIVQMTELIQAFIAAVRRRHPSQVQPANVPKGPGPSPDPNAGGAAALVATAQTEDGDAQPIHQQSSSTIEAPMAAESAKTHAGTSVESEQEVQQLQTPPRSSSPPANDLPAVETTAVEQLAPAEQKEGASPIEYGDTTEGQVATADATQQHAVQSDQAMAALAQTAQQAEAVAVLPPNLAPLGFPEKLIFDERDMLTPYTDGLRVTEGSFFIKTDPATNQSCLTVATSTGFLVDATATDARGSGCAGLWTVIVNGEKVKVGIDDGGNITFP